MKDMLYIIFDAMNENSLIKRECEDRIKLYIYPETGATDKPFITIRPLDPPEPVLYGSDQNLSCRFYMQIDVQSYDRKKCKLIQREIKSVMEGLGYSQTSGGLDTFFEETNRFVDARRYRAQTKPHDANY